MENLVAIIAFAILVEGTVEYIKLSIQKNLCAEIIGAFVFALVICLAYDFDLFAVLGITAKYPYVGNVLTALVISRGSNYVWDLIGKFTEAEEELEELLIPENETHPEKDILGEG